MHGGRGKEEKREGERCKEGKREGEGEGGDRELKKRNLLAI